MQRSTSVTGERSTGVLRYTFVPGRTIRFEAELELVMDVRTEPGGPMERLHAEISGDWDFEVVRVEDGTAMVALHPRNVDFWVKSDSTLDEDSVSDPLAGLPPAFLLDTFGNTTPLEDLTGNLLLRPDDTNAAPFIVEALFPLYSEASVEPGDTWEVRLEHGTRARIEPGKAQCTYLELRQDERGNHEPVIGHRYAYQWSLADGLEGRTGFEAVTRVSLADGWPRQVDGKVEIHQVDSHTVVHVKARRIR